MNKKSVIPINSGLAKNNNNIPSFDGAGSVALDLSALTSSSAQGYVDPLLFREYASEFPCLQGSNVSLETVSEFKAKIMNSDNDEDCVSQELAIDCILELLSGGDYEITWKDIFDVFSKEDQLAFIRVMTFHSAK